MTVTSHTGCICLLIGRQRQKAPKKRRRVLHIFQSSRRDFLTYERSKLSFKHVMEHYNTTEMSQSFFPRKFATLASLKVPSGLSMQYARPKKQGRFSFVFYMRKWKVERKSGDLVMTCSNSLGESFRSSSMSASKRT